MKNFSMPEQVSPTLEIDELMRLKHSLFEIVFEKPVYDGNCAKHTARI